MNLNFIVLMFLMWVPVEIMAQEEYQVSDQSNIVISGGSSLGNWETRVQNVTGKGQFIVEDGILSGVASFKIYFMTSSMQSENEAMDSLSYVVLKMKNFSHIEFELSSFNPGFGNQVAARGKLTIAGISNDVTLFGNMHTDDESIVFSGNYTLDMGYYKLSFPALMEPKVKVNQMVNINFDIVMVKKA